MLDIKLNNDKYELGYLHMDEEKAIKQLQGVAEIPTLVDGLNMLHNLKNDLIYDSSITLNALVEQSKELVFKNEKDYYAVRTLSLFIDFFNTYPKFNIVQQQYISGLVEILTLGLFATTKELEDIDKVIMDSKVDLNKKVNDNVKDVDITTLTAKVYSHLGFTPAYLFIKVASRVLKDLS